MDLYCEIRAEIAYLDENVVSPFDSRGIVNDDLRVPGDSRIQLKVTVVISSLAKRSLCIWSIDLSDIGRLQCHKA